MKPNSWLRDATTARTLGRNMLANMKCDAYIYSDMAINDEKQARHGKHEVQRMERCVTRQDQTAAELITCVLFILVASKKRKEPVFAV